ncbi:unnamed protein product, partial [Prorocentrum cordatum]
GAGGGLRTLQKDLVELKDAAVRLRAEGGTDDELEQADADVEEVRRKVRKASSVTGAPDPSSTTEAPHRRRRHGSTTTGPDPVDQDDVVEGPGVMSAAVEDPVVEQPAAAQQHHKKQEHSVKGSHSPHGNESESVSVANTSRDTVHKRGSATTSKAHKNTTSTLTSTSTTKITKTTTSTTKTSTTKTSTTTITRTTTTRTSTSTTKTSTTRTTTSTTVTTTTTTTSTSTTSTTSTSTTTTRHHVWGGEGVSSAHDGWLARLRERYRFASPCGVTACPVPAIENARLPEALRGVRSKVTVTDVDTERGSQSAVESEGMGHALMVEGIEALRGNKTGLNNALGLARGWLSMAHGPKERPHPLGGGGDVTADPATKCSVSPYGVSAVQAGPRGCLGMLGGKRAHGETPRGGERLQQVALLSLAFPPKCWLWHADVASACEAQVCRDDPCVEAWAVDGKCVKCEERGLPLLVLASGPQRPRRACAVATGGDPAARGPRGAPRATQSRSCLVVQYVSWAFPGAARAEVPSPEPEGGGFMTKVIGAAAQGATAAFVAAILSAVTEPLVNRLLVKRMTFAQAYAEVNFAIVSKFFLTTFPTNMLKFPVFEVINIMFSFTSLSGGIRGMINGFLFCTIMLPVTNYRFRKSMGWEITLPALYQAYVPTVVRDIVYGWSRGFVFGVMSGVALPKEIRFGITVFAACIISSPGNEWRGYTLQPKEKKLPFAEYFKPVNYARSTGVGATIMGVALGVGMFVTPYVETLVSFLSTLI